jgi:hypothetical protein
MSADNIAISCCVNEKKIYTFIYGISHNRILFITVISELPAQ